MLYDMPSMVFQTLFFKFWLWWMLPSLCRLFLYLWPVLLISEASLPAEHRLEGPGASVAEAHGLTICSSLAREHRLSSWGTQA